MQCINRTSVRNYARWYEKSVIHRDGPGVAIAMVSCGQWKVSALKGKKLCSIPNASAPGGVMMDFNESGTFNQSFSVRVFDGKIYTADNLLKRLQVLDRGGEPLLVIGPRMSREDAGDVKQSTSTSAS